MNTRKAEMLSFITKFPDASSAQVVDHMMEKFEGTERHQHRAALQRMKKSLKADAGQLLLPVSGRTQTQKPNVANKPKSGPRPISPEEREAFIKVNDQLTSAVGKAIDKRVKVATADPLPPQTRKKSIEHVTLTLTATRERQKRVLSAYHELPSPTPTRILRIIKAEFPDAAEPPTLAMIHQVFKAEGDSELYPTKMHTLFGERACPTCGCTAKLVDNVYRVFGFREQNARSQSYCRACRTKKSKVVK